jgi:hypothetical protein
VERQTQQTSVMPELSLSYDFYDDYLRLEVNSNHILGDVPKVILYPEQRYASWIRMHQKTLKSYIGRIELSQLRGRNHRIRVLAENISGDEVINDDVFKAQRIRTGKSMQIFSADASCGVNFWSGSLYQNIYVKVDVDSLYRSRKYELASKVYRVQPGDVLMKKGAFVNIRYGEEETSPEQLGVYQRAGKGKWRFVDNNTDVTKRIVSALVNDFTTYALIRDRIPPEITSIRPTHNTHILDSTPRISVYVLDRLSGIKSDEEIVLMLDGRRLIAEYDPERNRMFYNCRTPLAKGRHEISVTVTDRSQNVATRKTVFWLD